MTVGITVADPTGHDAVAVVLAYKSIFAEGDRRAGRRRSCRRDGADGTLVLAIAAVVLAVAEEGGIDALPRRAAELALSGFCASRS